MRETIRNAWSPITPAILSGLVALFVLFAASSAGATTVLKLELEGLVANSDRIVVGNVQSVDSYRKDGKIFTKASVEVDETWKGDETDEKTITIHQPGGRMGDTVTRVFGMPDFRKKERVIAFLDERPGMPGYVVTGLRQGKFTVAVGPDGATEYAIPRVGDVQLLEVDPSEEVDESESKTGGSPGSRLEKIDASKLRAADPAAIHQSVIPLDEFRERVLRAAEADGGTRR